MNTSSSTQLANLSRSGAFCAVRAATLTDSSARLERSRRRQPSQNSFTSTFYSCDLVPFTRQPFSFAKTLVPRPPLGAFLSPLQPPSRIHCAILARASCPPSRPRCSERFSSDMLDGKRLLILLPARSRFVTRPLAPSVICHDSFLLLRLQVGSIPPTTSPTFCFSRSNQSPCLPSKPHLNIPSKEGHRTDV